MESVSLSQAMKGLRPLNQSPWQLLTAKIRFSKLEPDNILVWKFAFTSPRRWGPVINTHTTLVGYPTLPMSGHLPSWPLGLATSWVHFLRWSQFWSAFAVTFVDTYLQIMSCSAIINLNAAFYYLGCRALQSSLGLIKDTPAFTLWCRFESQ